MNIKNKNIVAYLFIFLLYICTIQNFCAESNSISAKLTCENTCLKAGKNLKIKTFIDSTSECSIKSFKFTVKYDPDKFIFEDFKAPKGTSRKNFNLSLENDLVNIEYNCKRSNLLIKPESSLNICNFVFNVKGKEHSPPCKFELVNFEITDSNKQNFPLSSLNNLEVNFEEKVKPNCYLSEIVPSTGKLSPEFAKDIFEYDVYVSHDISFIDLDCRCENEFATAKVSRRKLAAAGKDTKILITVNDKKAKSKLTYTLNVHRAEKPLNGNKKSSTHAKPNTQKQKVGKSKKSEANKKLKSGTQKGKSSDNIYESSSYSSETDNISDVYDSLDSDEANKNSENYFDKKLIYGILILFILGAAWIYKKFIERHQRQGKTLKPELID